MHRFILVLMLAAAAVSGGVLIAQEGMPLWAYGYNAPPPPAGAPAAAAPARPPAPDVERTAAGSSLSFKRSQIYNFYGPADWFPNAHPPMPEIVARGRQAAS